MADIPYHDAKRFLEDEIGKIAGKYEGVSLPKMVMDQEKDTISVTFELPDADVLYSAALEFVRQYGKMEISGLSSGTESFYLEAEGREAWFHNHAGIRYHSIKFKRKGDLTSQDLEALLQVYKKVVGNGGETSPIKRLQELGAIVYEPGKCDLTFDSIAGYEDVKRAVDDTIILALAHPEVYERIARSTRKVYESNMPKAVLFDGPPGTGKTTVARIIASRVSVPMVYVPVESITIKWFGESPRILKAISKACRALDALMFLDEIDALAVSRDQNTHEESRRVLSVLLREIDGMESKGKSIVIGATNRKFDLDAALLSRFDVTIPFPLPDEGTRALIFAAYAKQLTVEDWASLGKRSGGLSGRNIKDICEFAERSWASKIIQGHADGSAPIPPLDEYVRSLEGRREWGLEERPQKSVGFIRDR